MKKIILLVLLLGIILIQFFKPKKNIQSGPFENNIALHYKTSESVQYILKVACNDCHSNNTEYPWYADIQPFAWYLSDHIEEGRKKLNFDEFYSYPLKKQDHKLEEMIEVIRENEMPLKPYPLLHTDARLTELQKQQLIDWAKATRIEVGYNHP